MDAPDLLANAAARFPDRPCVVEGERTLSFRDVSRRADCLGSWLLDSGVTRGERIALLAENILEFLEIQVAAMRAGVILVPLNYRLVEQELRYILEDCTPRVLLHSARHAEQADALSDAVERTLHIGDDGSRQAYAGIVAGAGGSSDVRPAIDAAAVSSILYTSGTTGRPKGAMLSNGALLARVTSFAIELMLGPGRVFVQALPMFHMAAHPAYAFTYTGATTVMAPVFTPDGVLELLERHRATHVLLVPTMIDLMARHPAIGATDLGSLELVLYGGSPIPADVVRRALDTFGCDFLQFYGMTETSGGSILRPADHDPARCPERLATAGTDALGVETRVVDADDRTVSSGVLGEILIRGPVVMDGYWNAPEATAEALRGGWMHTGDIGLRRDDGYLYVADRLKDMVVTGGENVYPREVEDAVREHPDVADAAVIGVPDERWGERVHAVVVPVPGAELDPDALIEHCRRHLAGYKVPKTVEIIGDLPRNPTGKVLKKELRAAYWSGRDRHVS